MRKYSPSWSFSGKYKPSQIDNAPGPGAYSHELSMSLNAPRVSIGRAKRSTLVRFEDTSPGPADYNVSTLPSLSHSSIGKGKKTSRLTNNTPGPGTYDMTFRNAGPKYTIRSKFVLKSCERSPGPGAYSPSLHEKKFMSYSIGKGKKYLKRIQDGPGPGQYNRPNNWYIPISKFPLAPRREKSLELSPGPGSYNLDKY